MSVDRLAFPLPGFGFRVSGVLFRSRGRDSGFGFLVSFLVFELLVPRTGYVFDSRPCPPRMTPAHSGLSIPVVKFWISGFGLRARVRVSGFSFEVLGFGFQVAGQG